MISKDTKFLIVGLGLIGGCYAMELSEKGYEVNAIARRQETIDYALEKKMIKKGSAFVDEELIKRADIIVFALYPGEFVKWIENNQHLFRPGTLITDVTGVKTAIVPKIQDILREDVEFIPAHPMAGREKYGVENSDPEIFVGANYIVTPTEKNTKEAIDTCCALGQLLGFYRVSVLSIEEHDKMIGFLSQLTHCIAVSLMTCNSDDALVKYTGDSFRDLTRIARINEVMWSELFLLNKKYLVDEIDSFVGELEKMKNMLACDDRNGLMEMMKLSTSRRGKFDKGI